VPLDRNLFPTAVASDCNICGCLWAKERVKKDGDMVILPEFNQLTKVPKGKERWVPMQTAAVPAETGSAKVTFPRKGTANAQRM